MRDLLRLFRLWRPAVPSLLGALLVALVTTFADLALTTTAGWFVTAMAAAGLAGATMNYFTPSSIIRFTAIVRIGGRWVDRVVGHEATFRLLAATRTELFRRLEAIAPAGLEDLRSDDVAARLKLDVDRLELVFLRLVSPITVAAAVGVLLVVVLLGWANGSAALVIGLLFVGGGMIVPFVAVAAVRRTGAREAEAAAGLRRAVSEHLEGLGTLLVVDDERRRVDGLAGRLAARIADERRIAAAETLGRVGQGIARDGAVLFLVVWGALALHAGRIAGPDLTALLLLALSAFETVTPVATAAAGLPATLASLRRIFAPWDREPAVVDPPSPEPLPSDFDLVCDGVGFSRPGRAAPILGRFDLVLAEGKATTLSRPSGWGKSTLADLLVRVRDPSSGTIRLGGVPLPALALADVRRVIALAPQRPHVFDATIAENLRAFAPTASDADLARALDLAGLGETIAAMPEGLSTRVGSGGARLSGGQVRRLALARVLLRPDVRILILDEPTEGLDEETARDVTARIGRATAGRSLLTFSHRVRRRPDDDRHRTTTD